MTMDNKEFDVVALGELLVDFTQNGLSEQGNTLFEANPGGAPANVLAMLRKLGKSCAFIGKVGKDSFGDMLARTVADTGIDIRGLMRDPVIPTTLAVVHTFPNGDRDFSFYRKPGADILLRPDELDEGLLGSCRIFHFGTLSLTDEPCKTATVRASISPKLSLPTLPMKAQLLPSLRSMASTFAGAPPGFASKSVLPCSLRPFWVKSTSSSPRATTSNSLLSIVILLPILIGYRHHNPAHIHCQA